MISRTGGLHAGAGPGADLGGPGRARGRAV